MKQITILVDIMPLNKNSKTIENESCVKAQTHNTVSHECALAPE